MLYTETDLEESMDKIETINFHEVKEVAGIKFWCYHAGHVLGAAMFMIEIAGVKVLAPAASSPREVSAELVPPSAAKECSRGRAESAHWGMRENQVGTSVRVHSPG